MNSSNVKVYVPDSTLCVSSLTKFHHWTRPRIHRGTPQSFVRDNRCSCVGLTAAIADCGELRLPDCNCARRFLGRWKSWFVGEMGLFPVFSSSLNCRCSNSMCRKCAQHLIEQQHCRCIINFTHWAHYVALI